MAEWIVHCLDCLAAWKARDWQTCPNCGGHEVYSGSGPGPDVSAPEVNAAVRRALLGG